MIADSGIAARAASRWLPWALAAVSVGLFLAGLVLDGDALAPDPAAVSSTHGAVEWTGALLALVAAGFALAHSGGRRLAGLGLAVGAFTVFALDAWGAAAAWWQSGAPATELWPWTASRLFLGLFGLAFLLTARRAAGMRGAWLQVWVVALAAGCAGVAIALPWLATTGALPPLEGAALWLPRAWDLPPLLALAAFAWLISRRTDKPGFPARLAIASLVPQILCQAQAAFGSIELYDTQFWLAHGQRLLAYSMIVGAQIVDYARSHDDRIEARVDLESVRQEVRHQTQRLAEVDRELAREEAERIRAEVSARILEAAVSTMRMGLTVTDLSGQIIFVNRAEAEMHGYRRRELLGKPSNILGTEDPDRRQVDASEWQPWSREVLDRTKTGEHFPIRLVSDVVRNEQGEVLARVTVSEDLRSEARAREALRRRDRILGAVGLAAEKFLASPAWEAGLQAVLESLRQAVEVDEVRVELFEGPHGDSSRTWAVSADPEALEPTPAGRRLRERELIQRWWDVLGTGKPIQAVLEDLGEEGEEIGAPGTKSIALVPILDRGEVQGYLILEKATRAQRLTDVEMEALQTAARTLSAALQGRRARLELSQSEARYQDLLRNANDLIQSVRPDGTFTFVNDAWTRALGYRQDEARAMQVWQILEPQHRDEFRGVLERVAAGARVERIELDFVGRDGATINLEGSLSSSTEGAGRSPVVLGIFRDITERRQVDRMKGEFLSTVSHDLRTPLTSIIGSVNLLEERSKNDPDPHRRELLQIASRNCDRLLALIDDLLLLQKLSAEKLSYMLEPVSVAAFLREIVGTLHGVAEKAEVEVKLAPIEEELAVRADRQQLTRVVTNLVSNALKFSPEGEAIELGGELNGMQVRLHVVDHGPGIDPADQDRIFDRFTQLHPASKAPREGSGLGLTIARDLVQGMGGSIDLDSEPGEGSTFTVSLPVA